MEGGALTIREASEMVGVSYRHCRRIYKRYREEGDRGQPSNRGQPCEVKGKVLALYREQYWDFGPTLAAEKLWERDGYKVDHETLRRWLLVAGLWERPKETRQAQEVAGTEGSFWRADSAGRKSSQMV